MRASGNAPVIQAGRLWAGGLATAVVAGLVALVAVLVSHAIDLALVPPPLLPVGNSLTVRYPATAAVLALVATGLAHLLLLTTPRPHAFFAGIVGLVTLAGVVLPFTQDGSTSGQLAAALIDLLIGTAVLGLLSSVMARTARPSPVAAGRGRRRSR